MNNSQTDRNTGYYYLRLLITFCSLCLVGSAGFLHAQQSVRPDVGKPLQAAIELLKTKKGKEALAKLKEAEAISEKTVYEIYAIDRTRGQAASVAGDAALAARSFEAAASSTAAPTSDRLPMLAAAAGQYYMARDYAKAAELSGKYLKDGGTDFGVRTVLVQSLYLGGDLARAGKETAALVETQEQLGKSATEEQLQLWASICLKQRDTACYARALEKLLTIYPKPDYWLSAIHEVAAGSGFAPRLALDVARLKLFTGTMRTTNEYFEAAQLSLQEGLPAEAKTILDRGYSAGMLGSGPEADRHRRLVGLVGKALADDDKTLGQDDSIIAAAKDGMVAINSGFNYVVRGQTEKGLALMEQGLKKGGGKRPEDAKLKYGIAQALAGRGVQAAQTLATVHGADGTAELARLWAVAARKISPAMK